MKDELKLKIFLKKSKLRFAVWNNLSEEKTASEIAKEIGKHRSAVSRVLLDLQREGFIKCINPKDKSFRHYSKRK